MRRGRVPLGRGREVAAAVEHFPVEIDSARVSIPILLSLARESELTAYDAAYLELAMRRGCPLATLDDALRRAADRRKIPLI